MFSVYLFLEFEANKNSKLCIIVCSHFIKPFIKMKNSVKRNRLWLVKTYFQEDFLNKKMIYKEKCGTVKFYEKQCF